MILSAYLRPAFRAETWPQYLLLDESRYAAPFAEAAACVMSPPLRAPGHQRALREALARGDLDVLQSTGKSLMPEGLEKDVTPQDLADVIAAALTDWREGDAQVIVTAGQLAAKSRLRKLFEDHPGAYATGIYDDPPSREEIEAALAATGLRNIPSDAMGALTALSRQIDPGDFRQTLEKLALYKLNDPEPVSFSEDGQCVLLGVKVIQIQCCNFSGPGP